MASVLGDCTESVSGRVFVWGGSRISSFALLPSFFVHLSHEYYFSSLLRLVGGGNGNIPA